MKADKKSATAQRSSLTKDLESRYEQMAHEEARESEALEWAEATIADMGVFIQKGSQRTGRKSQNFRVVSPLRTPPPN